MVFFFKEKVTLKKIYKLLGYPSQEPVFNIIIYIDQWFFFFVLHYLID